MIDKIKDALQNLNNRQKNLAFIVVIILMLGLGAWSVFAYTVPQYQDKQMELVSLKNDISNLENSLINKDRLENSINEQRANISQLLTRFNWQVIKGDPLMVIGEHRGIELDRFAINSLNQHSLQVQDKLWIAPYSLRARSNTSSIWKYVQYLEEQEKALKLNHLGLYYQESFSAQQTTDDIIMELELTAYGSQNAEDALQFLVETGGRQDVFEPTVTIPEPIDEDDEDEQDINGEEETGPRAPSYQFPSQREVR